MMLSFGNVTKEKKFHCTRYIHSALVYCHSYCVWRCSNTKRVCVWFQKVEKRQFREISRNENPNETKREKTIKKTNKRQSEPQLKASKKTALQSNHSCMYAEYTEELA